MSRLLQFPTLQPNLALALDGVFVALLLATVGLWLWQRQRPAGSLEKVGDRLQFLWLTLAIFVLASIYSNNLLILYLWFLAFLALKEFCSITPTRRADRWVLFWAYLAVPIQFGLILLDWRRTFIAFIPVYVFLFLPLVMVIVGETRGFLKAWSTLGWGMITTVFTLGFLAYLLRLPTAPGSMANGNSLFLFLVTLSQLSHAAEFIFGRLFNHPTLSLKVSVTRNWASLIGSMAVTAPVAWLAASLLTPFTPLEAVIVGLVIATGSFIGYIIMSAIKRDLQLKDRGTMTPGRGGVLNRIDAFIYTAPLYFYIVTQLYYPL
jgi:phosphatidate cytidylyltransferase